MKLTAFILLIGCLHAAATGHSQGVTITLKNVPLEKAFNEIEKESGYYFTYTKEQMEGTKNVSLDVKNADIKDVLELCFNAQPVTYEIIQKAVVVKKRVNVNVADIIRPEMFVPITGIITDSTGKPLEGANVEVKGTKKRTTTDQEGRFMIDAKEGDVLMISYVGYGKREITLGNETTIRVALQIKIAEVEGVTINTGYQKIKPQLFVGSAVVMDSAAFHRRAGMAIVERLDGTVTGVLFDKKDGSIKIRGISTLGSISSPSSDPLIILDNFRYTGDLSSINPNDVENITVLKDAAATSIYGARGGNGVIVITTKRGKYNTPFYARLRSNVTITEKPDLFYYPQMGISDFIDFERFLFSKGRYDVILNNGINPGPTSPVIDILAKLRSGVITQAEADQQINVLRGLDLRNDIDQYVNEIAMAQQYYANLGGGNNIMNYGFSMGYNRISNGIKNSKDDEQYTLSSTYSFKPLRDFEIQAAINFSQAINKSADITLPTTLAPYAKLVDENNNSINIPYNYRLSFADTVGNGKLLNWKYNPLDEVRMADINNKRRALNLNVSSSYRFTNWLTASINFNYNTSINNKRNYSGLQTYFSRNLINLYTNLTQTSANLRNPVPIGGILDISNDESNFYGIQGQLKVNKVWPNRHSISSILVAETTEQKSSSNSARYYGYDNYLGTYKNTIDYLNRYPTYFGNNSLIPNSNSVSEGLFNRFVSILANASYSYDNRFVLYASARRDGSNIFGVNTNNRWKPLWSVGGSWHISKEKFYAVNWMSSLRLSATYGYTGNVNNRLAGVATMSYQSQPDFLTGLVYAQMNQAPNPDLKWEEIKLINFALDYELLKNRISGRIDFYHKNANDLISEFPYPSASGVNQFTVNSASMEGNGFELNLSSRNTVRALKWNTEFGLSHAKMKITKLYANNKFAASDFIAYGVNTSIGRIAHGLSSYRWAGLDPSTGDPLGYYQGQVSKIYGSIFNDSVDNQIFHGSAIPLYHGYLQNSFSWKGISISFNITYRLQFYFRKPSINYSNLIANGGGHTDYARRWQKPGDEKFTNVPSFIYPIPPAISGRDNFYQYAEINVLRGDNLRLQDVRISYDKTIRLSKNNPMQTLQFFIYPNGLNLILWRKNSAQLDPDYTGGAVGVFPQPRTWTVGLNINLQ